MPTTLRHHQNAQGEGFEVARLCILIVEDETVIQLCAALAFEEAGHEVMSVMSVSEAVALLGKLPDHFAAIVTDYSMPGGRNGADLIAHVRPTNPTLPIVLTTALSYAVDPAFLRSHSVLLLPKPYDLATLVKTVEGLIVEEMP